MAFNAENDRFMPCGEERLMSGGGWSCPHELQGVCSKVNGLPCDPGMKGCELYGRYVFFDARKNERLAQKKARTLLSTGEKDGKKV